LRRFDTGNAYRHLAVEQVAHDHHRVVALFDGLPVEARRELGKRLRVIVNRHRDVLLRCCELKRDLLVERLCELRH
jgi:hypothetical protein